MHRCKDALRRMHFLSLHHRVRPDGSEIRQTLREVYSRGGTRRISRDESVKIRHAMDLHTTPDLLLLPRYPNNTRKQSNREVCCTKTTRNRNKSARTTSASLMTILMRKSYKACA